MEEEKKPRRPRGTGSIYQRGNIFWIKYYRNGKPYCESTGSTKETRARDLLKKREGEISKDELPGICFDKIRFDELAQDFLTDYRINKKRTFDKAQCCVDHLKDSL